MKGFGLLFRVSLCRIQEGSGGIDGMGEEELRLSFQTECARCVETMSGLHNHGL